MLCGAPDFPAFYVVVRFEFYYTTSEMGEGISTDEGPSVAACQLSDPQQPRNHSRSIDCSTMAKIGTKKIERQQIHHRALETTTLMLLPVEAVWQHGGDGEAGAEIAHS